MLSCFSFCPTRHELDIPFPGAWTLVVAHSGVQAEKTREAKERFNLVSRRSGLVVERYNELWGTRHQLLRDVAAEASSDPERWAHTAQALARQDAELDLFGRLSQFTQETGELIPAAIIALRHRQAAAFGEAIDRSHALSRSALGNIVPEVDWLQRSARHLGAVAASGFGAGFGGSAYAVLPAEEASAFGPRWKDAYLQRFPERAPLCEFFATVPSRPAGEL
jgi:galactokinase